MVKNHDPYTIKENFFQERGRVIKKKMLRGHTDLKKKSYPYTCLKTQFSLINYTLIPDEQGQHEKHSNVLLL